MSIGSSVKRALTLTIVLCALAAAQHQPPADKVADFVRSVASTIYGLAWPTAKYKGIAFDGLRNEANGVYVVFRLYGKGIFEAADDGLWVKLGILMNQNGIQDLKVLGHSGLFAGPFETSKAMGELLLAVGREYSRQQVATAAPPIASAVCVANAIRSTMPFQFRWGDEAWRNGELEPDRSLTYSWKHDVSSAAPRFYIRYDDSYDPGYTEQKYWLEVADVPLPATCEPARQYVFVRSDQKILLRPAQ